MPAYDVIVLGLGGMGSATLFTSRAGASGCSASSASTWSTSFGSSHGLTRIIRLAYWEHPTYVALLRRAYELWRELEALAGERLLHITGSIDAGPADGPVFEGALRSSELHGLPHEVMDGAALRRRFPGYRLPRGHSVPLPAGWRVPAAGALQRRPRRAGAGPRRRGALPRAGAGLGCGGRPRRGYAPAADATRRASSSSAPDPGPRSSSPSSTGSPSPSGRCWRGSSRPGPSYFRPDAFPVFNLEVEEGRYYGFPSFLVPGFKFGKYHHRGEVVDPDAANREPRPDDEELLRAVRPALLPRRAAGPTVMLKACLFTNSPDRHFILDRHPEHPEVAIAAGFSGPRLQVLQRGRARSWPIWRSTARARHDIEFFRLGRFAARAVTSSVCPRSRASGATQCP